MSIADAPEGGVQLQVPTVLNAIYVYPPLVLLVGEQVDTGVPEVEAVAGPFPTEFTARI
jgi:hypothetical protein